MIQPHFAILAEELVILHSKDEVSLETVEEGLRDVAGCALLIDDNSSVSAIFQAKRPCIFLNIANLLVIDIKELCVVEVILIILEVLQPGLVIGYNFPVALPHLPVDPPRVVPVDQHQVELVCVFVVLGEGVVLVKLERLVELALEGLLVVVLLVDAVGEGVAPLFVELFHVLLEV